MKQLHMMLVIFSHAIYVVALVVSLFIYFANWDKIISHAGWFELMKCPLLLCLSAMFIRGLAGMIYNKTP